MIDPAKSIVTTIATTRDRAITSAPAKAPIEVPAPVTRNAIAAPWLMPASTSDAIKGSDASDVT
jgi:hypothetical protein